MKRQKYFPGCRSGVCFVVVACLISLLSGCATNVPTFRKKNQDRQFIVYEDASYAYYEKNDAALRWGSTLGGGAILGTVAYQYQKNENKNAAEEDQVEPSIAAALGVVGGVFLGGLAGGIIKSVFTPPKKDRPSDEASVRRWLKRFNPNMVYVSGSTAQEIVALPRSAESTFAPQSVQEVELYIKLFPGSPHFDGVFQRAINEVPRHELPELVDLSPQNKHALEAKQRYINLSLTISHANNAARLYPELQDQAAEKAAHIVSRATQLREFKGFFKESPYAGIAMRNAIQNEERSALLEILLVYPYIPEAAEARKQYVARSSSVNEAGEAARRFPQLHDLADEKAASLATDEEGYRAYITDFPNGKMVDDITRKLISLETAQLSKVQNCRGVEECIRMARRYPRYAHQAQTRAIDFVTSVSDGRKFLEEWPTGPGANAVRSAIKIYEDHYRASSNKLTSGEGFLNDYFRYATRSIKRDYGVDLSEEEIIVGLSAILAGLVKGSGVSDSFTTSTPNSESERVISSEGGENITYDRTDWEKLEETDLLAPKVRVIRIKCLMKGTEKKINHLYDEATQTPYCTGGFAIVPGSCFRSLNLAAEHACKSQ